MPLGTPDKIPDLGRVQEGVRMYTREEREGILWEFHRSGLSVSRACRELPMFPHRNVLADWLRAEAAGELVAREMPGRAGRMHCTHRAGGPTSAAARARRGSLPRRGTGASGRGPTLADIERHAGQTDWRDWGADLPEDPCV
jgi:putative transposase